VKAGLAYKEVAVVFEAVQTLLNQVSDLSVSQIHEQPVGEYHIELVGLIRQLRCIAVNELNIAHLLVELLVFLNEVLDKVDRDHLAGLLCQYFSESADAGAQFQNTLVRIAWQDRQDLRQLFVADYLGVGVQHHLLDAAVLRVLFPVVLHLLAIVIVVVVV